MDSNEFDFLIEDIRKIIINEKIKREDLIDHSDTINKVQEGLLYLSNCMQELNEFSTNICNGNLDAPIPGRENLLVGSLKELHGVLRHLTWQSKQVAKGDYSQRVDFLGDFSNAFNTMIVQLEQREKMLNQSMEFLKTIMDGHHVWILVEDISNGKILYNNREDSYPIAYFSIDYLGFVPVNQDDSIYYRSVTKRYYSLKKYEIQWQEVPTRIYYITDVTKEQKLHNNLSKMVYKDVLTDTYNRRYCFTTMKEMLEENKGFCISLIDINNLKYVNDNYGHNIGDMYIHCVVDCMNHYFHQEDIVCRIGGDEFVILSNRDIDSFSKRMDSLFHTVVKQSTIDYETSISYGAYHIEKDNELSMQEIIDECDKRMYDFKNNYKQRRGV